QQQRIAQRQILNSGEAAGEMLYLLGRGELEQPPQAAVRCELRVLLGVEQRQAHAVAVVDNSRVADQCLLAAGELDLLRQLAEVPARDALALEARRGALAELAPRLHTQLRAQRRQIAPHCQFVILG